MTKITLNDLANLQNENTAVTKINQNNATIEEAFDNTLSRDGSTPNQMEADLDMNSNDIINVKEILLQDGMTWAQLPTSPDKGSMIYRGDDAWEVVEIGPPGSFLSSVGGIPTWNTATGTGDMLKAAYDPNNRSVDVYEGYNHISYTLSDMDSKTIPSYVEYITTSGYATEGDLGAATYKKVDTEPTHAGKFQSADGAWWEIVGPKISLASLGGFSGNNVDDELADAIDAAAGTNSILFIPSGNYTFLEEVDFSPLFDGAGSIELGGDIVFDFTGATDNSAFGSDCLIKFDAGPLIEVGQLGNNFTQGQRAFSIASPAISPQTGDILCIYCVVDGSYNAARSYYRAGEFVRVASYSSGLVVMEGSLMDNYSSANNVVYKHPNKSMSVTGGSIFMKEPTGSAFDDFNTLSITRVSNSDFSAFKTNNPAHAGHVYSQCVGIYGSGYSVNQNRAVGSDNYGVVFANCQDVNIDGNFSAVKHGVTAGGGSGPGCVPNSHIYVTGTFRNVGPSTPGSGITAANFHGNTRYSKFGGYIDGGISMGGNFNGVYPKTVIVGRGESYGLTVLLAEMVGHDFDFSDCVIIGFGDPAENGNATFDVGANGNGADANTKKGGTIRLDGATMIARGSTRPVVYLNRGYAGSEEVCFSIQGFVLRETDVSPIIVISNVSGNDDVKFCMHGFQNLSGATYSISAGTKVRGWSKTGSITLAPSTSASVVTGSSAINAPRKPTVSPANIPVTVGGARAYAYVDSSTSATSVVVGMATADSSSFPSSSGATIGYIARLDE